MKKIMIVQDVRFLGVAYPVGKVVEVEDAAAAEMLKFGFAQEPLIWIEQQGDDPGGSGSSDGDDTDQSHDDADQSQSTGDQIRQKSLFAAPENKAIGAAEENKKEE